MDKSSFANRLEGAGVPRDQAWAHAELVQDLVREESEAVRRLIREELRRQESDRQDRFWSTFFIVACMSLLGVVAIIGAMAAES